jgi:hypothetical protein
VSWKETPAALEIAGIPPAPASAAVSKIALK